MREGAKLGPDLGEDFRQAVQQAEQDKQLLMLVESRQATMYITIPLG